MVKVGGKEKCREERRGKTRRGERGAILILTLLVLVLLAGALALAAAFVAERQRSVVREGEEIRLTALADAALAETLAHMSRRPGYPGLPEKEFGEGTIESTVEIPRRGRRTVLVRAVYRERERRVEALVALTASGPRVLDWKVLTADPSGASSKE